MSSTRIHDDPREPASDVQRSGASGAASHAAAGLDAEHVAELVRLVRDATQFDLSRYQEATVKRQIVRRMQASGVASLEAYVALVRARPDEARSLRESVWVTVTCFYRDPAVFERVGEWLRNFVATRQPGDALRLWVPGCATGEEAYSFAMLLHTTLGADLGRYDVQVFATDADERSVTSARAGIYARAQIADLPESLVSRFFVAEGHRVRVAKEVRDLCVFATHDLTKHAPFRGIHLVSCRNVLIYLQREMKTAVIEKLHYALVPDGCLVLGSAESTGLASALFDCLDPHHKLYVRRPGSSPRLAVDEAQYPESTVASMPEPRPEPTANLDVLVRDALSDAYVPPTVVVDAHGEVLYTSGDIGRHLHVPRGKSSFQVSALCLPALRGEVKTLLHLLSSDGASRLVGQYAEVEIDGTLTAVRVVGRTLRRAGGLTLGYALSFEELPPRPREHAEGDAELDDLRRELSATREHLHSLVEQLEGANERMLSTNQELSAFSEELQSANEELQATNEELLSLNEELSLRTDDLARANDTLASIQNSIQTALVVVDGEGRVLGFNALAVRIFGLLPRDHGRLITAVPCTVTMPDVLELVRRVNRTGESSVLPLSEGDRHYLLQVSTYEKKSGARDGAVLAFTDVSDLRRVERESARLAEHLRATFEHASVGIVHVDLAGRFLRVNPYWCRTLGRTESELTALKVFEATHPDDRASLRVRLLTERAEEHFETRFLRVDGAVVWARGSVVRVAEDERATVYYVLVLQDVSDEKRASQQLTASERELRQIVESLPSLPWSADADGMVDYRGPQWATYTGFSATDLTSEGLQRAVHPDDIAHAAASWERIRESGEAGEFLLRFRSHEGQYRWFSVRAEPLRDEQGRLVKWFGLMVDVHEQRELNERLQATLHSLEQSHQGAHYLPWMAEVVLVDDKPTMGHWVPSREPWALLRPTLGPEHPPEARRLSSIHPDDLAGLAATLGPAIEHFEPLELVWRTHPDAGPTRWLMSRGVPIFDELGRCSHYAGMLLDITTQKRAEEAHRVTAARLERATAIARVGHFSRDLRTGRGWNDAIAAELLGLPAGECAMADIFARLDPDGRQAVLNGVARVVEQRGRTLDQVHCYVVDGARRWLRVRAEPEYDADGHPTRVLGAYHDVTELHEARLELERERDAAEALVEQRTRDLRQKERHLSMILEGVPCAIAYWDAALSCRFANRAFCTWVGVTSETLDDAALAELTVARLADRFDDRLERALAGEEQIVELREGGADAAADAPRWLRAYVLPDSVRDERAGVLALVIDITDLKRAEQRAEEASRAKGQFLANMSHEIRTPLNAVLGLSELGMREVGDRVTVQRFGDISRAGRHLLTLINDVLDFSRIEAGKLQIESAVVDLGELEAQVVTTLASSARERGLAFTLRESASLPRKVESDGARLAQILINLLSNAIKFTERGHVHAALSYADGALLLEVADTGAGISEEIQRRLFQPFEQGVPRGGDRASGTGLGLAICKRIVALMDGNLTLVSQLGVGTTVRAQIPCKVVEEADLTLLAGLATLGLPPEAESLCAALGARGIATRACTADGELDPASRCLVAAAIALVGFPRPALERFLSGGGRVVVLGDGSGRAPGGVALPVWLLPHVAFVDVPAAPLSLLPAVESVTNARPVDQLEGALHGVRVLAAEDNDINRLLLAEMLATTGATLICVEDGGGALAEVHEKGRTAYDVVLCDVEMPGLDGYDTTRALKVFAPDLPVIGLTAHAFEAARSEGARAGMNGFVTKPYTLRALTEAILAVLPQAARSARA